MYITLVTIHRHIHTLFTSRRTAIHPIADPMYILPSFVSNSIRGFIFIFFVLLTFFCIHFTIVRTIYVHYSLQLDQLPVMYSTCMYIL